MVAMIVAMNLLVLKLLQHLLVLNLLLQHLQVLNLLLRDPLVLNPLLQDLPVLNLLLHLLDLRCKDPVQDILIPDSILKTNLNAAMKTIVKATIRFLVGAASILTKVMTNYLLDLNLLFRDILVLNLPLRDLLVLKILLHLLALRYKDLVQDLLIPDTIPK